MRSLLPALGMLAGCTDHLLIGAADPDDVLMEGDEPEPLIDATLSPHRRDAGSQNDAGPLAATFRVFEREDVSSAVSTCGASCTELEVVVRGGLPPYEIAWADGELGAKRTFCPDSPAGIGASPVVTVRDTNTLAPSLAVFNPVQSEGPCDDAGAQYPGWQICLEALSPDQVDCGPGTGRWYALREPLFEPDIILGVSFEPWLVTTTQVQVHVAAEPCETPSLVWSGDINTLQSSVMSHVDARAWPMAWVVVMAPNEADRELPPELRPTLSVCFNRWNRP